MEKNILSLYAEIFYEKNGYLSFCFVWRVSLLRASLLPRGSGIAVLIRRHLNTSLIHSTRGVKLRARPKKDATLYYFTVGGLFSQT